MLGSLILRIMMFQLSGLNCRAFRVGPGVLGLRAVQCQGFMSRFALSEVGFLVPSCGL